MEPVKLATGIGGHGPQILYSGGRQPPPGHPPGTQVVHPPTTRSHEGSPYKGTISPPMVSRGAPYPSYTSVVDGGHGGTAPRYLQQPTYLAYPRDSHYARSMADRPVLMPQAPKRPSIMGGYSGYSRDMMQMLPTSTLPVSVSAVDSCKRIKLSQPSKTDVRFPLVIDTETNHTSRETSYYPQVEAISPTLPSDPRDESPLHSTKDDLIKQIEQVDKDIAQTDAGVINLRKKEKELESAAAAQKGDATVQPDVDENKDTKHQSTAQIIYAENRKIAEEGHNSLAKLIPPLEMPRVLPLYHQPSDTEVYHQNRTKYSVFKQSLLEYFKKKQEAKYNRELQITQTYTKLMNEWVKKVDKIENSKKHKEKVGKNRELFEKVFPELRKQREDKERFSRVGARVKSDAEMEEIIDGIQDQENEDKKMRAYAVIPPILLDEKRRSYRYANKNSLVEDPLGEHKERKNVNLWTEQECEVFKDKYLQHPKNFVIISSYLERKSVSDCIQNYYLTKKKENYKLLVKRRMRRPRNKGGNQPTVDALVPINSATGVTTRGSAAAAQKEMLKIGSGISTSTSILAGSSSASIIDDTGMSVNGTGLTLTSHTISTVNWSSSGNEGTTVSLTVSIAGSDSEPSNAASSGNPPPPSSSAPSASSPTGDEPMACSSTTCSTNSNTMSAIVDSTSLVSSCQEVREKDKENLSVMSDKVGRRERNKSDDSSDEENLAEHGRGGPHECVLCKTRLEHFGQSRPVSGSQASQYGLNESSLPPNARVCSNCRCRTIKRRVPQCLIPTCSTAKWRVKRLRPFPSRWNHLPASLRDPIIKELKIPSDVTKSCSACHNRIIRKLGSDAEEPLDTSRWSEEDIENLRAALREVGCHWSKVTEKVKNKTQGQCKSFYFNLKSKYKLDEALSEYRKAKGKTDPPTVTDEEESGSSTSSGDEAGSLPPPHLHPPPQVRHDSASDTASASSPPLAINNVDDRKEVGSRDSIIKEPPPPAGAKEDNDSSATASADEGQNGMGRDSPPEVQHIPHPGERRPSSQPVIGVSKCLTPGRNLLPPPPATVVGGTPNTPNFKQIIDNTIEETIAKSAIDNRGYHSEKKIPVANDHITITTLLENSSYSQKIAGRAQGGWNYPPVSHQNVIDTRTIPERHSTPTPYDMECCEGGLDLTVKKRDRSSPPPSSVHPIPLHPQSTAGAAPPREIPTMTMRGGAEVIATGKGSPPRAHSNSISYSQSSLPADRYLQDYRKSPSNFSTDSRGNLAPPTPPTIASIVTRVPSPHMVYGGQPPRQPVPLPKTTKSSMAPPPPMAVSSPRASHAHISPVPPNSGGGRSLPLKPEKSPISMHGSITHGTPVNQHTLAPVPLTQANRYEMITKPIMTREGGSITQGTPVHHDGKRGAPPPSSSSNVKDTLMMESRSGVEIIPRPSPVHYEREAPYRPPRPTVTAPSSYPYTTYAYTTRPIYSDSQISSRQIIETDYLTSQQMAGRRGAHMDKEIRISPRSREQVPPPQSQRDHRGYPPPPPPQATPMDRRALEQHSRGLESRPVDHRVDQRPDPNLEFRPVDVRTIPDGGEKMRKIEYVRTLHGYVPIHSQSSGGASHYITTSNVRVSRPSISPASVRDATPTPPTSETTLSPHDFRSPGVSTPTPPPRLSSVIQRQPASKPHMPSSKGGSPRPDAERYSPQTRQLTVIPSMGGEALTIADMLQRPGSYPNMDVRREGRPVGVPPHHSVPQHERHQLEGIGKQMVETLQNSRYISETQGNEREKEIHTVEIRPSVDDRRFYDRMDYNRVRIKEDYRNITSGKILTKESEESNNSGNIILNFQMDQSKAASSPKSRVPGNESLTAANLIEAIITNHINQGHVEEVGRDPRSYRREGEPSSSHSHNTLDSDKRVRSPATVSSYHSSKDKEIVTVEDGTDLSTQSRHTVHKDGLATLHVTMPHHTSYSKNNPGHMEPVGRDYTNAEGKKKTSASHHYSRPPLEITRTDGRAVTHLNLYDHSKIRSSVPQGHHTGDKDGPKEHFDSRSHRMSPSTSSGGVHVHSTSHLATDERQIIRIVQPQSQCPFDYIKNKLQEIWREGTPENAPASDRRNTDNSGARHSRSATPINQQQQPPQRQQPTQPPQQQQQQQQQQHQPPPPPTSRTNAQYEEESAKKRPRLDHSDSGQRPPSRPRSTGGVGGEPKEEVADSPQSGEMVIDETPREGKLGGESQHQDKGASRATVNQYSNSYPGYRGGGNQPLSSHSGNWGVNAPPPPPTSLSGSRPQGYEPNVEPVSDDD